MAYETNSRLNRMLFWLKVSLNLVMLRGLSNQFQSGQKAGGLKLVVDYHRLNSITLSLPFYMHTIEEVIAKLSVHSTLDD